MMICHVCGAQCPENQEFCSLCGAQLNLSAEIDDSNETAKQESNSIENPVLAVSTDDVVTAEIYKDILTENEIPYYCDNENGMSITFGGGFSSEKIYVDESNLELSKKLYENLQNMEFEDFDDEFYSQEI